MSPKKSSKTETKTINWLEIFKNEKKKREIDQKNRLKNILFKNR